MGNKLSSLKWWMSENSLFLTPSEFVFMKMADGRKETGNGQKRNFRFCSSTTLSIAIASLHILINGLILLLISVPNISTFPMMTDIKIFICEEPEPIQEFLFNYNSSHFYDMMTCTYVTIFLWYFFWFIWGFALLYGVRKNHSPTLSMVTGVKFLKIIGSLMAFFVSVITAPKLLLSLPLLLLVMSVYFMPLPFNSILLPMYLWTFGPEIFLWVLGSALLDYWIICILNDFQLKFKTI